ncbi:Pin3p [Saccharomyces cerevisiae YJM1078]|uniref:Pin3p n=1 Tax=Saccharomyces paradoxus TaxID=27291 RepID=A0A8B8V1K2_SACPA|nr:Pin3 [Saccharomyces paradoxus]AJP42275.1 Pin3p [Saccharomyces cerevisiae YJM1078]AJV97669.1 Pin3p [Saccharomyces cerevisiae YJM248]CAI4845299.1 AIE_G0056560.mRNA.1.CDS.1 [Saccharomyces cerevisiae]QHS76862.1 Pin3 [Saccharomyces paradoxus]CAI6914424.1 AIE_G0056560.mRNA.1.CDS.1 [Saccharomyces cerevisiae]
MSASLINRSLTNIRTELDFLKESNVITNDVFDQINKSLPVKWDPSSAPRNASTTSLEYVEALYQFDPQQDGDLGLKPGDKVQLLEKLSPEWYKGSCNGRTGIFPANYVKAAFSGSNGPSSLPPPPQYKAQELQQVPTQNSATSSYQQQPFPPPSTYYYQQPQQQPQQAPPPQQQQQSSHSHLKSFGSKLGNAAIFGAGASIGSDIVNNIF